MTSRIAARARTAMRTTVTRISTTNKSAKKTTNNTPAMAAVTATNYGKHNID